MPSDEEEVVYHEIFSLLDSDGNGGITLSELSKIMTAMEGAPPLAQIEEIFKQCDDDENGTIDADEFINVVETVKLLQNRSTTQILESIKNVKYTELFRLADPAGTDTVDTPEVTTILGRLPTIETSPLADIVVTHEQQPGKIHLEGFKALMAQLTKGLKIHEALEHCRKGLREMLQNREAERFYSNLERSKSHGRGEEGEEVGVVGCEGCKQLQGKVKHHKLQVDAERAIIMELRSGLEEGSGRLEEMERMNKDLVFENEKLKKKLRDVESGLLEKRQKVDVQNEQLQVQLTTAVQEKQGELNELTSEVEALKKHLSKKNQESARQASALALLHKHVAQLEKDNETLKKGGDREHIKEYMSKQKVLSSRLEDAQKTIESMQQNSWFDDKLSYLSSQKRNTQNPSEERSEWRTDPRLRRPHPGSIQKEYGPGGTTHLISFTKKHEILHSEPTEGEYKVLTNYYHRYMAVKGSKDEARLAAECGDDLTKVGAHHPAYWTGKNYSRLKTWMKHPVVPDSLAGTAHRKRYVVASSRSGSSAQPQPPVITASPSIPPSALARSISPSRRTATASSRNW